MPESDFRSRRNRWPYHSAHFWCGLLAGVGVGLLLGAALVELGTLATDRKAWVSLVGALLVGAGGLCRVARPVGQTNRVRTKRCTRPRRHVISPGLIGHPSAELERWLARIGRIDRRHLGPIGFGVVDRSR
jgi:hypothetical protein